MASAKKTFLVILGTLGGLIVVVVAAVLLYLTFGDLSRFRPQIETAASDALGREFRIAGELEIEALPHPSPVATDVTLANADWASAEPMLSVGRFAVEIDLWSLLAGPVVVEQLEIADTSLLLEQDAEGRSNLDFEGLDEDTTAEADDDAGEGGIPVVVEHASITSLEVVTRQPDADDFTIAIESLDAETTDEESLVAMLTGRVQDFAVTLDASLDPASALVTGGAAAYRLEASIDDAEVAIEGDVDALFASSADAVNGVVRQRVRFDGSVASLRLLGAAFDMQDLPEQELTVTGDLAYGSDGVAVDPLTVGLGDSDFSGAVSAEFGEKLSIVVEGESSLLDLTPFLPPEEPATEGDASTAATAEAPPAGAAEEPPAADATEEPPAADGELLFPDEPLPLESLAALDLMLNLAVAELAVRDMRLQELELELANADGQAQLAATFNAAQGGSAEAVVALDASTADAALDLDVTITDLRLNLASGDLEDPSQVPPIGVVIDIDAGGATPHALAASANGRLALTMGAGLIENNAVGLVSGDIIAQLFTALNPFAKDEEYTTLDCTVIGANIVDGVATLDPILLETEKLQVVGGGEIELDSEALDVEFNTKPRSGVGITADMFVTPFVKLSGTLAQPGIGLNARGALLQGGAAVLTGGATLLLGGLADRATAQGDQCETALTAVNAPPAATAAEE